MKLLHEDKRGKIFAFTFKDQEYIILETRKGYSRGGDYHKSIQHDVVLKGKIKWEETFPGAGYSTIELKEGESNTVSPGIPHMLTALEDSVVLEWLEGDFEKEYYEPYRKIIKEQLK